MDRTARGGFKPVGLEVPDSLGAAFASSPNARAHFEAFPKSARRGMLEWLPNAKKPETRVKRTAEIAEIAENANQNERSSQWR